MTNRLRSDVAIKGTNITGKLVGKGFVEGDGKVEEKLIIEIDTSKTTIQDIAPYLKQIVVDPNKLSR